MAISFDRVIAGDTLYDVRREKMGNTTMRRTVSRPVYVREVDTVNQRALCSWNGNPAKWMSARDVSKLRRTPHNKGGAQ